jgi:hypothetical protein
MLEGLTVDEAAERPGRLGNAGRQDGAHFAEQATLELVVDAACDALGNLSGGQAYANPQKVHVRKRRSGVHEMRGQRPTCEKEHFQSPDDPFLIARLDARRGCRIDPLQQAMKRGDAAALGDPFQPRAQGRVAPGPGKQPSRERSEVETRSTDDEGQVALAVNLADDCGRVLRVLGGGVFGRRFDDVDEMMRNPSPIADRYLVGADVEAPIDRGRVAIDDLAGVLLSQRERQRALAGRRRPENRNDEWSGQGGATSSPRRRLVVEERQGEKRLVGRVFRRQLLRRIGGR